MLPKTRTANLARLVLTVLAVLVVVIIIFPFAWIVLSSLRDPNHLLSFDWRDNIPHEISFASYALALRRADLFLWLRNSMLVALSTTALSLAVAAPLAFALSHLSFRGQRPASALLSIHYAIPSITIAIPLFVILVAIHFYDSLPALVMVHTSLTIPFATWVLRDFYHSIPHELVEAGFVDGASLARVLRYIILPLSIPALLAAGAYAFILSWNDLLFALVLLNSASRFTAPIGIEAFFSGRQIDQSLWAQLMAASTMVSLPSVILFGIFQRYLASGFLSGAVKG